MPVCRKSAGAGKRRWLCSLSAFGACGYIAKTKQAQIEPRRLLGRRLLRA